MQLDKNPRTVVCIMSALGVFVIGVVLTMAFFDDTTILGVGVAMAVIGGAASILGCINIMAKRDDESDAARSVEDGIAPPRIPPPKEFIYRDSYRDANQGALYYEPCTSSPPRQNRQGDSSANNNRDGQFDDMVAGSHEATRRDFYDPGDVAGGVIYVSPGKPARAAQAQPSMLSPLEQRSYPLPPTLGSPLPSFTARQAAGNSTVGNLSLNATRTVDAVVLDRNLGGEPSAPSYPWQASNPQGVVRRVPFQGSGVQGGGAQQFRTPSRGHVNAGGEDSGHWSPQ